MKVVLLAGGFGTRLSEESAIKPKPMVEIGGMPILWHIMKSFAYYGHNEFIICAGYKQHVIKEWFANYFIDSSDITFDYTSRDEKKTTILECHVEPWKVTVVDTGLYTMTGGRIKRIQKYIEVESVGSVYIGLIIAGAMSSQLLIESQGRYKYSIEPVWCVMAAMGVLFIINRIIRMKLNKGEKQTIIG